MDDLVLEGTQHGKGAVEGAVGVGQLQEGRGRHNLSLAC